MIKVIFSAAYLALTPAIAFSSPVLDGLDATSEVKRVDPAKVLDLINRIKKSGGGTELLAQ